MPNRNNDARQKMMDALNNPLFKNQTKQEKYQFHIVSDICDDEIFINIKYNMVNDNFNEIEYFPLGCSLIQVSSELFSREIINKDLKAVKKIMSQFEAMINLKEYDETLIPNLNALKIVALQKSRIKCISLFYEGLKIFLQQQEGDKYD